MMMLSEFVLGRCVYFMFLCSSVHLQAGEGKRRREDDGDRGLIHFLPLRTLTVHWILVFKRVTLFPCVFYLTHNSPSFGDEPLPVVNFYLLRFLFKIVMLKRVRDLYTSLMLWEVSLIWKLFLLVLLFLHFLSTPSLETLAMLLHLSCLI